MLRTEFERLIAMDAKDRALALGAIGDADLRAKLAAMLVADAQASGDTQVLQDQQTAFLLANLPEMRSPFPEGTVIGAYTLEAWIGDGGSASVYRAYRSVEGTRQTVAFKLLRRNLQAPEAKSQFDRERRVLARLEHAGIARWIDGGITPEGQGYLVLEFVDGQSITNFARTNKLSLRARLQLMIDVAMAVDAAHRALIVHRDLKPGNLLVTQTGQIKLLDFGIAKLLEDEIDVTQTQARMFTPAYAAPEQREGGTITTATDVYALGVVLGELLTGKRLRHDSNTTPSLQIDDQMAEVGALAASPEKLRQLIKGDLDTILLKALDKDPQQRYASAAVFADDLTRFLEARPILAHPPSRWYRTRKFINRNRVSTAAIFLLSMGLLVASGLAIRQAQIARQQAIVAQAETEKARLESKRANAVSEFLTGLFETAQTKSTRGERPSVDQLVATARMRVLGDDSLDAQTKAEILISLAEVSLTSAEFKTAEALLQQVASLIGSFEKTHVLHAKYAICLARWQLSRSNGALGLQALRAASVSIEAASLDIRANAYGMEASMLLGMGKYDEGVARYRDKLDLVRQIPNVSQEIVLYNELGLGQALDKAGRKAEAMAFTEPALARWRELKLPKGAYYLMAQKTRAAYLSESGKNAEAQTAYEQLLKEMLEVFTPPHPSLAVVLSDLGTVALRNNNPDRAIELHRQSLAMMVEIHGDAHVGVVSAYQLLGISLLEIRQFSEALPMLKTAVAICEKKQFTHVWCPRSYYWLGRTLQGLGRVAEARAALSAAEKGFRKLFASGHSNDALIAYGKGSLALAEGDIALALAELKKSLEIFEANQLGNSGRAARARSEYAKALLAAKNLSDASTEINKSIELYQSNAPVNLSGYVTMLSTRARVELVSNNAQAAAQTAKEALSLGAPDRELDPDDLQNLRRIAKGDH